MGIFPQNLDFHCKRFYIALHRRVIFLLWGVRGFQAFISSPALIFWCKKLIWLSRYPLFLLLLKWMAILSQFLCVFSNSFRNKNKGDRDNQINFSLQNINAGDEMKAWKSLTPHNMYKSYPSKVRAVPDSMKFLAARYLNTMAMNVTSEITLMATQRVGRF